MLRSREPFYGYDKTRIGLEGLTNQSVNRFVLAVGYDRLRLQESSNQASHKPCKRDARARRQLSLIATEMIDKSFFHYQTHDGRDHSLGALHHGVLSISPEFSVMHGKPDVDRVWVH